MPMACRLDVLYGLDVKVGLNLEACVKGLLLELLNLSLSSVSHRHKALLQPGGRFSLFFVSS